MTFLFLVLISLPLQQWHGWCRYNRSKNNCLQTLNCKSKHRFYLSIFFDLIDVTRANSHTVYMKIGHDISLLNFKLVVTKAMIGRYSNGTRSFSATRPSKQKSHKPSIIREAPTRMPELQQKRVRCGYCQKKSSDLKSFVSCQACGLYLRLTKNKNFLNRHLQFSITISFFAIHLLKNRLFLCRLFGFLPFLLCGRICLRNFSLAMDAQIQLQSLVKSICN